MKYLIVLVLALFTQPAWAYLDPGTGSMLLQADVTPNDEQDVALYKHFGIIGPPSIMFFDKDGKERRNFRVVGFVPADEFAAHVNRAFD